MGGREVRISGLLQLHRLLGEAVLACSRRPEVGAVGHGVEGAGTLLGRGGAFLVSGWTDAHVLGHHGLARGSLG